jgi:hypothetical protein
MKLLRLTLEHLAQTVYINPTSVQMLFWSADEPVDGGGARTVIELAGRRKQVYVREHVKDIIEGKYTVYHPDFL